MTFAIPTVDDLVRSPELASLATLEIALIVVARGLRALYPDIDRCRRPGEDAELAAAAAIVDDCDILLYSVEHYRARFLGRLARLARLGCGRLRHVVDCPTAVASPRCW